MKSNRKKMTKRIMEVGYQVLSQICLEEMARHHRMMDKVEGKLLRKRKRKGIKILRKMIKKIKKRSLVSLLGSSIVHVEVYQGQIKILIKDQTCRMKMEKRNKTHQISVVEQKLEVEVKLSTKKKAELTQKRNKKRTTRGILIL